MAQSLLVILCHHICCNWWAPPPHATAFAPSIRRFPSLWITKHSNHEDDTIQHAKLNGKGECWIRLPIDVDYFHSTIASLEALLQNMFLGRVDGEETSVSDVNANIGVNVISNISSTSWSWSCDIPTLESSITIQLLSPISMLVISMNATDSQDFGWICSQFYSQKKTLERIGVDCETSLRKVVASFFNELPPDPGDAAWASAWTMQQREHFEQCLDRRSLVHILDEYGYIVLDGAMEQDLPPQPELSANIESSLLLELTNQGNRVRTDRVLFVSSNVANACGLGPANAFLRGIAHYLNENTVTKNHRSNHDELLLLTLPDRLQFAEYGHMDFYKVCCHHGLVRW